MADSEEALIAVAAMHRRTVADAYGDVRARVLRDVASWKWTTGEPFLHVPVPHWSELHGIAPSSPKLRDARPRRSASAVQYGLDAAGLPVVCRNHLGEEETPTDEHFVEHSVDEVVLSAFGRAYDGAPGVLSFAARGELRDGLLMTWTISAADDVFAVWTLHYEGARLCGASVLARDRGDERPHREELTLVYEADGQLVAVREDHGDRQLRFRAPRKRGTDGAATRALLRAIPRVVAKNAPAEPVFAVALIYDHAVLVPPSIALITSADALAAGPRGGFWQLAYENTIAEQPWFDDTERDALAAVNAGLAEASDDALPAIVREVARQLQDAAWPDGFSRAEDFVVVALDAHQLDVERDLALVLGPARIARLHRDGYL